ncbi:hypothetical protein JCM8202_001058 [Rhodotorula sphaerocarpa]
MATPAPLAVSTHPDTRSSFVGFQEALGYYRFSVRPTWPLIQRKLVNLFGSTRESRYEAVDGRFIGIELVVETLAQTSIADDPRAVEAAIVWLSHLESAVTRRISELPPAGHQEKAAAAQPAPEPGASHAALRGASLIATPPCSESPRLSKRVRRAAPREPESPDEQELVNSPRPASVPELGPFEPINPRSTQSDEMIQALRSIFPQIGSVDLSMPSSLSSIPRHRTFHRAEIGGSQYGSINKGTPTQGYDPSKHHVTLRPENNISASVTGELALINAAYAFGQPFVIITSAKKARNYLDVFAIERPMDDGTTRAACSLFLRATDNQWVYRGIYELASSGELALDLPAPSANSVDPRLRAAVEARIDPPQTREGHQMLDGWGWPLPAAWSNREEQKKALWTDLDAGDAEPVLSYLVLRCIGWSEHDFKVWEMNRNASQKRKFPQPLSKLSHINHPA